MLCAVSTGKSGSTWLERLRTAKGFTDNGASDLENFIQNPNSPNQERHDPCPDPDPISGPARNEDKQLFNIMSDVLHELFNYGDNCDDSIKIRKSGRKQANPRICAFSNNCSDENNNAAMESRRGDSSSGVDGKEELGIRENEGEEDGRDVNFSGFSRTEVTVIDTSYEMWKSEKLLYRKKNVWRVRDKKGKGEIMGGKKKRKVNVEEDGRERKKRKVDVNGEKCELLLNEVYHPRDKPEGREKALEEVGKVPKTKQADMKLENGNSSVVLIKSIPIGKKLGTSISKTSLKSKQIKP
ncbi:hypothetical protein BUALT_Bualt06G0137500 [Buddleja alternifolia]|uniref:Uncharacterized protein n=1 Tax=Buddleja alternifolia TaxID=168488 RepID=A0AAV6XMW2_9LAMI|nr:hypothetical protein BUALT_Bualt06G0137500 [Buddleja alternifolia]